MKGKNQPFIKTFSKYSFNATHRRLHRTICFYCGIYEYLCIVLQIIHLIGQQIKDIPSFRM